MAHRKLYPSPTDGPAGGPAVARAGIDPATPHAMRHTFVSLLIDQGLSVEKVAEQARHRDPGFTWRVYRHRFEQRALAGSSDSALAMENVRAQALAARKSGGRKGDGPLLRVVPDASAEGGDPS